MVLLLIVVTTSVVRGVDSACCFLLRLGLFLPPSRCLCCERPIRVLISFLVKSEQCITPVVSGHFFQSCFWGHGPLDRKRYIFDRKRYIYRGYTSRWVS